MNPDLDLLALHFGLTPGICVHDIRDRLQEKLDKVYANGWRDAQKDLLEQKLDCGHHKGCLTSLLGLLSPTDSTFCAVCNGIEEERKERLDTIYNLPPPTKKKKRK